MTKYLAYQVDPAYQEPPLYFEESFFPENISVFGNKSYEERFSEEIKPLMKSLKNDDLEYELSGLTKADEEREVLNSWFTGISKLTDEQVNRLASLIRGDMFPRKRQDVLCGIFSILTGKQYDYQLIRGSFQGDWNYIFFVRDEWTDIGLGNFSTEYFNTGTEWTVHASDEDEDDVSVSYYTHWWSVKECREEIADMIGCDPEDIQMFEFAGYVKTPKYTECVF